MNYYKFIINIYKYISNILIYLKYKIRNKYLEKTIWEAPGYEIITHPLNLVYID